MEFGKLVEVEKYFADCKNAKEVRCRAQDFDLWLRQQVKYTPEEKWPDMRGVREKFFEIFDVELYDE